jgi:AcrR family transcriptional regulator
VAERATRAQGRNTVRKLMAAGLAEFTERGFAAVTVDDIVRRANASHGTFYLYFANKSDFFAALSQDAMHAMEDVANDFPVVTPNDAGRAALGRWVRSFCETYAAHATVFRIMTQADDGCQDAWEKGLTLLTRLAEVVSLGMTAGMVGSDAEDVPVPGRKAELDALACLLMLERVNYLCSAGVQFKSEEFADRLTAIIFAALHTTSDMA